MPRDPFKPLLLTEQKVVFHFIREGCAEERLNIVARKCRMKEAEAKAIYRRKHVQEEIHRRKSLVEFEEHKLIARDKAKLAAEEDERHRVTLDKIEKVFSKVLDLDPEKQGPIVLKAIELGLVYTGTIRNGNQVKLKEGELEPGQTPLAANAPANPGPSFYRSIFAADRESDAEPAPAVTPPAPLLPEEAKPKTAAAPAPKPAAAQPAAKPAQTPAKSQAKEIEIT